MITVCCKAAYRLLLTVALAGFAGAAQAAPAAGLAWSVPHGVVGQPVTLSLTVANVDALYGVQAHFSYDSELLDASTPAVQVGSLLAAKTVMELRNEALPRKAVIEWVFSRLRPALPVSGDGELAVVQFTPRQAGVAFVEVSDLRLGSVSGDVARLGRVAVAPLTIYESADQVPAPASESSRGWLMYGLGGAALFLAAFLLGRWRSAKD